MIRARSYYVLIIHCTLLLIVNTQMEAQDVSSLPEQKPFTLRGSVGATTTGYGVSGIERRREPFSWTVNGSFSPTLYGVQMPIHFIFSEQDREFRQPFNQFGISPQYKWITTHFGYNSMEFSRYTLAGVTFLGAGVELTPGVLRLAGMVGRFQRAVEEDTLIPYILPAYERNGFAVKVGFGTEENFVDLSYLRAKDDSNSLLRAPARFDVTPAENAVFGLNSRFTIIPELTFETEGGASLFTRDIRSPNLEFENEIPGFLLDFYDVHSSTTLTFALRAGLNLKVPNFGLRLGYERIEPDYTSLGAYYFTTDIENWTIAPSFDLFDSKLRVSGSIGIGRDNLLDTKLAETSRLIGSANVGWSPDEVFGIDAQFTNYSTGQSAGRAPINDTIRVRNVTTSASLAPRVMLNDEELSHFVTLIAGYQQFTDQNAFTSALTDSESKTASLIYNLSFIKSGTSVGASLLFADTDAGAIDTRVVGFSLNGGMSFLDNTLRLAATVGYSTTDISGLSDSFGTVNENLSAAYRITREDQLLLRMYATQSGGVAAANPAFNETTATLGYSRTFSWEP
jgi:hypothetical protein